MTKHLRLALFSSTYLLHACSGGGADQKAGLDPDQTNTGAVEERKDAGGGPEERPDDPSRPRDAGTDDRGDDHDGSVTPALDASPDEPSPPPDPTRVYALASGCYVLRGDDRGLLTSAANGEEFAFTGDDEANAARFFLKASDLGSYLFYDQGRGYLVAEDGPMLRQLALLSDLSTLDDSYVSGAEWQPQIVDDSDASRPVFRLRHLKTGVYLGPDGLVGSEADAIDVRFEPSSGCTEHPELSVDASGAVTRTTFEDGTLYGIVETHTHMLSNFGFGGGGIFHGSPFHRLGVQHALPDCEPFHGRMGRKDVFGYAFSGGGGLDAKTLLPLLLFGELSEDYHETAGYPEFSEWPSADSPTHQTQYYRWLERAYLAGLRLVVQHATTNSAICEFVVGEGYQPVRYSCNDMVGVDRQLEEVRNMERYIDAQAGGPGKGFFRIVDSPRAAREVIAAGKMAVVLGIETSNLFDCFSVPRAGMPTCDEAYVRRKLDEYYALGVRVMFPVHKYDNAFSAGDGHRNFIELGNFINSGHYSNFVEDCPADLRAVFDHGKVTMGGLNRPRDEYASPPPVDMSHFEDAPVRTLAPHLLKITSGSLDGEYCQKTGLTDLGETLMREMMMRGMVIEIDHFPMRSLQRAYEVLEESDYPAAATHGNNQRGRVYALGGVSKVGLGRCRAADRDGAMVQSLLDRVAQIRAEGGYPAEGLGLDLNGFAGMPGPRFGERSSCGAPQADPLTYPFSSYAGDVTFSEPFVGSRRIDFNTEGLVHVGMLPELIQDARADASSDADLEPLFRSAEGYLRMWERSEARGAELRASP